MRARPSIVFLLAAIALGACGQGREDEDGGGESVQALTEHPVFKRYPSAHGGSAAAWFDGARGGVFSLERRGTENATWIEKRWAGDAWVDTAQVTTTEGPNVNTYDRSNYAFAFDAANARLVFVTFDTVWAWSNGAWSRLPATNMPPARSGFAVAFDGARDKLVFHGGMVAGSAFADTWEYDGSEFVQVSSNGPARMKSTLAFDRKRGRIVAYGGMTPARRNDTWEWNGSSWTQRATTGPDVSVNWGTFAVWDEARDRVAMFGNRDAWEWTGSSWSPVALPSAWPGLQMPEGLAAYDPVRKRTILWSGSGTVDFSYSTAANKAPVLEDVDDGDVYAGEITTRRLVAQDEEGDALTYSASPLPDGATIDPSGLFRWQPRFDQVGPVTIEFTADDGARKSSRSATIRVREPEFAEWLPAGPVASRKASVTLTASQTDMRTNGSINGNVSSPMTAACELVGENPTALSIKCRVSGRYASSDGGGSYSVYVEGKVNGNASFYADSRTSRGNTGRVRGRIEQSSSGDLVLVVEDMFASIPRRFGMTGWLGHTHMRTLTTTAGSATFTN